MAKKLADEWAILKEVEQIKEEIKKINAETRQLNEDTKRRIEESRKENKENKKLLKESKNLKRKEVISILKLLQKDKLTIAEIADIFDVGIGYVKKINAARKTGE